MNKLKIKSKTKTKTKTKSISNIKKIIKKISSASILIIGLGASISLSSFDLMNKNIQEIRQSDEFKKIKEMGDMKNIENIYKEYIKFHYDDSVKNGDLKEFNNFKILYKLQYHQVLDELEKSYQIKNENIFQEKKEEEIKIFEKNLYSDYINFRNIKINNKDISLKEYISKSYIVNYNLISVNYIENIRDIQNNRKIIDYLDKNKKNEGFFIKENNNNKIKKLIQVNIDRAMLVSALYKDMDYLYSPNFYNLENALTSKWNYETKIKYIQYDDMYLNKDLTRLREQYYNLVINKNLTNEYKKQNYEIIEENVKKLFMEKRNTPKMKEKSDIDFLKILAFKDNFVNEINYSNLTINENLYRFNQLSQPINEKLFNKEIEDKMFFE